jgi:hypothetical protein
MQEKKARTEASSSHTRENFDEEESFTNFMNLVQHSAKEQILRVGENLRAEWQHEREDRMGRVLVLLLSASTCAATFVSDVPCSLPMRPGTAVINDAPLQEQVSVGEFSSAVHAVFVNTSFFLETFPPFTPGLAMPLAAASMNAPMFSTRISAGSVPFDTAGFPSQFLPGTQQYVSIVSSSGYSRPVSFPFGQGNPSVMSGSSSQFSSGQTINAGQIAFPSSNVPYNDMPAGPFVQQVRQGAAVSLPAVMYDSQLT